MRDIFRVSFFCSRFACIRSRYSVFSTAACHARCASVLYSAHISLFANTGRKAAAMMARSGAADFDDPDRHQPVARMWRLAG